MNFYIYVYKSINFRLLPLIITKSPALILSNSNSCNKYSLSSVSRSLFFAGVQHKPKKLLIKSVNLVFKVAATSSSSSYSYCCKFSIISYSFFLIAYKISYLSDSIRSSANYSIYYSISDSNEYSAYY